MILDEESAENSSMDECDSPSRYATLAVVPTGRWIYSKSLYGKTLDIWQDAGYMACRWIYARSLDAWQVAE